MLAPGRAQRDLHERQVARLVGNVASHCFHERVLRRIVRVARKAQRLADGVAKPRIRNAFQRQDRGAAVLGQPLEQLLAVGAFDGRTAPSGDGADAG